MDRTVQILGRKLYSPSLKNAAWLEDAQLNSLYFFPFVLKFGWVDAVCGKKIIDQFERKLFGAAK